MRPMPRALVLVAAISSACTRHADTPTSVPPTATAAPEAPANGVPAVPSDALQTASGLRYVVRPGPRAALPPDADDDIIVRYQLSNARGEIILRSSPSDTPETLQMSLLPKGWGEAMQQLSPGDRAQVWIPAELGFAEADLGPTGPLYVDVELVDVARHDAPAATLSWAAPPTDAIHTKSGLAYVVVRRGTGTTKPGPRSRVSAHYDGRYTDGSKFDSSYDRNAPIDFELHQVIAGWTEMLQLMVVGDLVRVWIPVDLAYKGAKGRPAGTLVFDIELLDVG